LHDEATRGTFRNGGSVLIACLITLYFFRKNIIGLHESSDKALRIMWFTSVVAVIVLVWSGVTLAMRGPTNALAYRPDLSAKVEYETEPGEDRLTHEPREVWKRAADGQFVPRRDENGNPVPRLNPVTGGQEDPLGFMPLLFPGFAEKVRTPTSPWTIVGLAGLLIAFGHSVLAMSGEETLAQVYREVESPKLTNFKKAGFVIFVYSLLLTAGTSFLAVLLIPEEIRTRLYADNLLGGLAMHVVGTPHMRLVLNALVVIAGFLILSGAVNTSLIGSNGVLNRVADDGVLPDWLQNPHPRYGTTYRMLYIIAGLQLATIVVSRGNMNLLGEAYAFGVVWSFAFKAVSMVVLRFQDRRPREFKVPINIRVGSFELPVGLGLIAFVLTATAIANLFTKEVATVSGIVFTALFMTTLIVCERLTKKSPAKGAAEHLEQVSEKSTDVLSDETVGLALPNRKLVAVQSPRHLEMLQKVLEETDPETTEVIVMKAKTSPSWGSPSRPEGLDRYDRQLITAVIELGETIGKPVKPLVVPTNHVLYAIVNTAASLGVQEIVVGTSHKMRSQTLLKRLEDQWNRLPQRPSTPPTIRVLDGKAEIHRRPARLTPVP
jgi:amino acid transporter